MCKNIVIGGYVSKGADLLGKRIRKARSRLHLSQKELAVQAGFSAHQIVSQIERGEREVRAWELARIAEVLHLEITDLLTPEGPPRQPAILWREGPAGPREGVEAEFVQRCRRYQRLEEWCGVKPPRNLPSYEVSAEILDFPDAEGIANEVARELSLGTRPATALAKTLEEGYGVKIFYKELAEEGSAASTVADFGPAILMSAIQAPWRRNYSFAHELFHLVTWRAIPVSMLTSHLPLAKRIERLANAFASNLLLPGDSVSGIFDRRVEQGKIKYSDLIEMAREFDVSTEAILWRLLNLRRLDRRTVQEVLEEDRFRGMDRATMKDRWWSPPRMPERFVRLAFLAYQKGRMSKSLLADYLETSLVDLGEMLSEYGLDENEDYETEVSAARC